jgi:hypothetical protein
MGLKDFLRWVFGVKESSGGVVVVVPEGTTKIGIGRPEDLPEGQAEIFVQLEFKLKKHTTEKTVEGDYVSPWDYLDAGGIIAVYANDQALGVLRGKSLGGDPYGSKQKFRAILKPGKYNLFAVPMAFTAKVESSHDEEVIAGYEVYPWTSSPVYVTFKVTDSKETFYSCAPLEIELEGEIWNALHTLTFVEGDTITRSVSDKALKVAEAKIPAPVKVGDPIVDGGKVWVARQNGMEATPYRTLDEYNKAVAVKSVKVDLVPVGLPTDPTFILYEHDPTKILLELPSVAMGGKNTVLELNYQYVKFTGKNWWIHIFRGIKTLANLGWDSVAPSYELNMFDVKQELGQGEPPVAKPAPEPLGTKEVAKEFAEKGKPLPAETPEGYIPYLSAYDLSDYYRHKDEGYNDADAKALAIKDRQTKNKGGERD